MEWIHSIFGEGNELTVLQMCCRSIIVFAVALVLIRISGRRSFGVRTPLDNIIAILLGAILSRAVVGASPFIPIIASSFVIVIVHRFLAYLLIRYKSLGRLLEGEKILLYKNGFIQKNMDKALVCKEDIIQGVRESALTDDMTQIEAIYIERNGEISVVKKDSAIA